MGLEIPIREIPIKATGSAGPKKNLLAELKWTEPQPASNVPKDTLANLRSKAAKMVNSELFNLSPKILSVFGVWFSLTGLMKLGEKGLAKTLKDLAMPIIVAITALGFDYFAKGSLKDFINGPEKVPVIDLEKDLCWSDKNLENFTKVAKLFMGDATNHLGSDNPNQSLHGTRRDGLLVLAGPPGNGKTAIAHGIANLAKKPIITLKLASTFSGNDLETAFADALRKNAILFIDEADALIRSRAEKITQTFLETFNRYQRENPVRVILATNTFDVMDPAIQSRAFVFNLGNPDKNLKLEIFQKKISEIGLKVSAYEDLMSSESNKLADLLDKYALSGRDIESIIQDARVIAELRISRAIVNKSTKAEMKITLNDIKQALDEFIESKQIN